MRKLSLQELERHSPESFAAADKNPFVIVLDNVRSMHNIGSVFRSADAFAVEKIYLCGITATPPHREIHKSALGAEETVAWEHVPETHLLMPQLKTEGYIIAAVEQADKSMPLQNFRPEPGKKYAFVFGNEVFGVDDEVVSNADICLEIPQFGTKHSFNISVTVGIVLWQAARPE
ncbi:MAG: RNA methyltransferase [Bacteroidota bacterium]